MVSFSDLPKDVIWLIFRQVISDHIETEYYWTSPDKIHSFLFEEGHAVTPFHGITGKLTCGLALISKDCLRLLKSKCVRAVSKKYHTVLCDQKNVFGWLFIKGSLSPVIN